MSTIVIYKDALFLGYFKIESGKNKCYYYDDTSMQVYSDIICIKFPYDDYKGKLCFEWFMNIFRELGYNKKDINELEEHYNRYKDDSIDEYYYVYINTNKYVHGTIISELYHNDITFEIPYDDFCEYNAKMGNSGLPF